MITKTLSVVFTDIKGFTARTSSSSRAGMLRMLEKHEELLKPLVLQHGGTVVKTIGDAFLLTFESPTNAVLCGMRMQARLRDYNAGADEAEHIEIRVAINTGEVELVGSDVFGDAVNLASRVEGITDAGEVYFTEATYLVMNKQEVPTSQVGEYRFKGIPEAVTIYRVLQDENLELYRKVLETQMVPDVVAEDEGSVPEGAFSSGLLLALEQQKAMLARRRWDPLIMAVAVVVLLGLLGGAYLGWRAWDYRAEREEAARLLAGGQARPALERLASLHESDPSDPVLLELLDNAVSADVRASIAGRRFDEALERIAAHGKRYPDLSALSRLTRDARLAKAEEGFQRNVRGGRTDLEALLKDYPDDTEIQFRLAYHSAESLGGTGPVRRAMFLYRQVVEADPATYERNEHVLSGVRKYLAAHYAPEDPNRTFIAQRYRSDLQPFLAESLGNPKDKELRRNAYALLRESGDLMPAQEFRFFTAELFYRTITERTFHAETFSYFEGLLKSGLPSELKNAAPDPLPPAHVLKRTSPDRKRALPIVQAFFPAVLKQGR
jgi:class 3 adenylate cyclase